MALTAITAVGSKPDEKAILAAIRACGVEIETVRILSKNKAMDVFARGQGTQLEAALRLALGKALPDCDVFVQAAEGRKKRLLLADMDATMIEGESLDDLAAHLGITDQIQPITRLAMSGEIDFSEALRRRIALLKGAPEKALHHVAAAIKPAAGAKKTVAVMKRHGTRCVLVSGGFDPILRAAQMALGFDARHGNTIAIEAGRITGDVLSPILGREEKKRILLDEAQKLGISSAQAMTVGDGANDLAMLQAAGAGVGYHAKPAVAAAVSHNIRFSDMISLLYMQGYSDDEAG